MSSNFDKIVKLACKPKNAPPKSKYVDVLVSATFADDGSLNDILRSLSLRLREPNAVVVFKALLTLHQMIRSGSTDQLLEVMAQGDQLRLQNVGSGNWEGYTPPSSMSAYGAYLHSRVKAWKDLKHDLVAVQTESNRRSNGLGAGSKARRLRHLPVDKGLLREVKQVQTVLNALIQCKFYDDDLRDENTVLAFRMLVKDLLVLFQAGNEGVCNILEHYFEMSKQDASESFDIYKSFIRQTDKVVDYLGVAKKLHNIVNVPVPNLKHAPTGLVKALEEYLNDPNFEQNRREYKASLGVVEGKGPARTPSPNPPSTSQAAKPAVSSSSASQPSQPTSTTNAGASSLPPAANQKIQDFFESIQSDQQPTMFGGPPQGFAGQQQQQQVPFNPFRQSMMMPQQTGFMQPQMTGYGGMPGQQQMGQAPFLAPQMTGQMAFGQAQPAFGQQPFGQNQQPFGQGQPFTQPQQTGFMQPQQTGFVQQPQPLQPQTTGSNPFRQSMMLLNTTGTGMPPHAGAMSQPASPFGMAQPQILRPGSSPAFSATSPPKLVAQATGSKNPFAPAPGTVSAKPQEPKGMSMAEMAWNKQFGQQTQSGPAQASPWGSANGQQTNGNGSQAASNGTGMGDVASAFNFDFSKPSSAPNDFMSQFGSLSVNTNTTGTGTSATSPTQFNSLSSNPTGFTSNTSGFSSPVKTGSSGGPLQPQTTGFGGSAVKRFQPTSSFGSQLVSELPPIHEPGSNATSPNHVSPGVGNVNPQQTGFPGLSSFSQPQTQGQNGQPAQLGQQGLSPQQTGGPNPFRQSMFGLNSNNTGGPSQPFGSGGPFGPMGSNGQSGPFGGSSPFAGQNKPQGQPWQGAFGQQQQQGGSLL